MLTDLKRSKKEVKELSKPVPVGSQDYAYGLVLHLGRDELDKLKVKTLPSVGDEYHIHAIGKVTSVSSSASEQGEYSKGLDIQITMMDLMHESEADEKGEKETPANEEKEERRGAKSVLHSTYRGKK